MIDQIVKTIPAEWTLEKLKFFKNLKKMEHHAVDHKSEISFDAENQTQKARVQDQLTG